MKLVKQICFILKNDTILTYDIALSEKWTMAVKRIANDFRNEKAKYLEWDGSLENTSIDFREIAAIRLIYQEEKEV